MSDPYQSNPYSAPVAAELSQPDRFERKLLEFYRRYREQPPNMAGLVVRQLPVWCLLGVVAVTATLVLTVLVGLLTGAFATVFVVGMLCGAIGRDFGILWRFVRAWPLIRQLLDWDKIERLLDPPK